MRIKFIIIFTSLFAKPTVAKMPSAEDLGVLKRMGTVEKARCTCMYILPTFKAQCKCQQSMSTILGLDRQRPYNVEHKPCTHSSYFRHFRYLRS